MKLIWFLGKVLRDLPGIVGVLALGERQQGAGSEEEPQERGCGCRQHGGGRGAGVRRPAAAEFAAAAAAAQIISARRVWAWGWPEGRAAGKAGGRSKRDSVASPSQGPLLVPRVEV